MKNKIHFIVLSVLMMLYLIGITVLNMAVYGSVIQWNLSVLSLLVMIPLYLGFRSKVYSIKVIKILWAYMVIIIVIALFIVPKYTDNQAYNSFDDPIRTLRKHVGNKSFFYKGDYYIKTEKGNFSYNIKTGEIKGVENEYK